MRFFLLLSLVAAAFALTPVQKTFLSAKEELEVQCNSVPDNPGGCNNAMGHCEFCILHSTYCSQPDITNIVTRCSGGGNFQDCLCAKTEHEGCVNKGMEKKDECCAEPCTRARTSCAAGCCQKQIDDVAKCQPNDCTPKCGECTSESSAGAGDGTPTEVPACPPPPPPGKGRRELSAWQSFVEEEMMDGCSNIGYSSPNPPPACPCDDYYPIDTLSDYNPCAEYKKKGKGPGGPGH